MNLSETTDGIDNTACYRVVDITRNMEHSGTSKIMTKMCKIRERNNQKVIKEKIIIKKISKLVFTAQYKCPYMFMSTGSEVRKFFIQRNRLLDRM